MATVGVIGLGEMGACLTASLRGAGARVVTSLAGRGEATRRRAAEAGAEDLALREAVAAADLFLSVLPPARAVQLAGRVAVELRGAARTRPLIYLDANAVSPGTARRVAAVVEGAGARFVDGGIIGVPPNPLVYLSGACAGEAIQLLAGLRLADLGPDPGRASALKMCYAAFTKGSTALASALLIAAARLGVGDELEAELRSSAPALWALAERSVPAMPGKAHRWVGEMEEIAATFEAVGLAPGMLLAAADIYRLVEARGGAALRAKPLAEIVEKLAST